MSHRPLPGYKILVYEKGRSGSHPTLCFPKEILDINVFYSHSAQASGFLQTGLNQIELNNGKFDQLIILGVCNTFTYTYIHIRIYVFIK